MDGNGVECYQTLEILGSGRFGVVKKVMRWSDREFFACKVIRFREGEVSLEDARREYTILSRLNHPNIVKYIDYRWRPDKAKLYMEYCSEGNLQDFIRQSQNSGSPLSEGIIWSVLAQLASALIYCHYGIRTNQDGSAPLTASPDEWDPVIHRDIKPANVLVSSNTDNRILVKLGDFGLSKVMDSDNAPASYAGTPQYQPPEIARSHPTGIRWTKKCDVFSLGCTLYAMCTWRAPFSYRMEELDVFDDIPKIYSDRLQRCIAVCIAFHSEDRHDAFDLLRVIQRLRNDPTMQHLAPAPAVSPALAADAPGRPAQSSATQVQENRRKESSLSLSRPVASSNTYISTKSLSSTSAPKPNLKSYRRLLVEKGDKETSFLQTSDDETVTPQPMQNTTSSSPDGKLVASASGDKTVTFWDSATGARRGALKSRSAWDMLKGHSAHVKLKGHSSDVSAVAFSPDGKLVASASWDKTVRLWDTATGVGRGTLEGHSSDVNAVAFSPDGKLVASASWDKTVRLWDTATGARHGTLEGHSDCVNAVAFSPDGKLVVSASGDKTVRLWDSATGAGRGTLKGHSSHINAVAFSPDGKLVASASNDETVRLWDSATGTAGKYTLAS